MADVPEDQVPNRKPAPKIVYRGLDFSINRDVPIGAQSSYPGNDIHEIELAHDLLCGEFTVTVWVYGDGRVDALAKALGEIYLLVISHHARCKECRESIVWNLVGTDEDGGETGVFGGDAQ